MASTKNTQTKVTIVYISYIMQPKGCKEIWEVCFKVCWLCSA